MRPKSAAQTRKLGEMPLWARVGPIDLRNYNYRAEKHCADRSNDRGGKHPTITLMSPELPFWRKYFEHWLGGHPWAFQRLLDAQIAEMTVPEQEPQWFDPSFDPQREYPQPRPAPIYQGEYERVRKGFNDLLAHLRAGTVGKEATFTPDAVKRKYGISDEEWNRLPDQPENLGYWQGLRKPKDTP